MTLSTHCSLCSALHLWDRENITAFPQENTPWQGWISVYSSLSSKILRIKAKLSGHPQQSRQQCTLHQLAKQTPSLVLLELVLDFFQLFTLAQAPKSIRQHRASEQRTQRVPANILCRRHRLLQDTDTTAWPLAVTGCYKSFCSIHCPWVSLHGAGYGSGCWMPLVQGRLLHRIQVWLMLGFAGQWAVGRGCIYLHVRVSEAAGWQVVCVHCNRFLLCSHIFIFVKCQRVHRTLVVQATGESNNSK